MAAVGCGDNHSAAITKGEISYLQIMDFALKTPPDFVLQHGQYDLTDGRLVTWGCNLYGQLGYVYIDPKDPYLLREI